MKKFNTTKGNKVWEDKMSVECIDYSILLTKVFGETIDASQAFMYLFRRYGFPNIGSDDYKDLCAYAFHTDNKDIIVRWRIHEGDYHHHLCAFVPQKMSLDIEQELRKPYRDYSKRCARWAKETKGYLYYSYFELWNSDNKFCGNIKQETEVVKYINENHNGEYTKESWHDFYLWKESLNNSIRKEYENIEPFPKDAREGFVCQFDNQIEAGEKQHQWILSLPENSLIPVVYFAAMRLFESWKRYTFIRDVYFNMTCKGTTAYAGKRINYSKYAGYGITENMLKKLKT